VKGTLRQRTLRDGTVVHDLVVSMGKDPATGRYRQKSHRIHATTKRDIERERRRILAELDDGRHRGTDATVAQMIERWFDAIEGERGVKTLHEWRGVTRHRILPTLGALRARVVRTGDLNTFYRELRKDGLAPATIRQVHSIIRQSYRLAVEEEWLDHNPAVDARKPKAVKPEIDPPDPSQVRALMAAAVLHDPDFAAFLMVAAATGARRGEVCGLRWSDLDPVTGVLRLSRSISVVTGRAPFVKDIKNHCRRAVTLDPDTLQALELHRGRMAQRIAEAMTRPVADPYIFTRAADASEPLNPDLMTQAFVRLRTRLGLPTVRLHDLRHFHGSWLLDSGVPLATVSARLGHQMQSTTLNFYSHAVDGRDEMAAGVIGELLRGTESKEAPATDPGAE